MEYLRMRIGRSSLHSVLRIEEKFLVYVTSIFGSRDALEALVKRLDR